MFIVRFNNAKKRGRGVAVKYCEAWGTLYPSCHVHVDTLDVRVTDFLSLQQMREYFEEFGTCEIEWQVGGTV
jgi:hypothetical protein